MKNSLEGNLILIGDIRNSKYDTIWSRGFRDEIKNPEIFGGLLVFAVCVREKSC